MDEHELANWYGPEAAYSEHKRGERVIFLEEEKAYTGVIIWVCASCKMEGGIVLPVRYIVEANHQKAFPCIVSPGDIIERGRSMP